MGKKNGELIDAYPDLIVDMCIEQLVFTVVFGRAYSTLSSVELITFGLWDPVRIFVKNEPHSEAKLAEGRVRLIANVSLRTQLIERFVCSKQNNLEIANWWKLPVAPGIGLDDESLLLVKERVMSILKKGELAMTDVSGWDWSVKLWMLWADAERRRCSAGEAEGSLYDELLKFQAYATASSVYGLSTGELIAQLDLAIQNSGSYKTSSTNSWMRVILFLVAYLLVFPETTDEELEKLIDYVLAMGDDCVEILIRGIQQMYGALGFKTSLAATTTELDGVEFCSHVWNSSGNAYPTSWVRTLVRFFSKTPGPEITDWLAQLDYVLRHHPRREFLLGVARAWVEQAKQDPAKDDQV